MQLRMQSIAGQALLSIAALPFGYHVDVARLAHMQHTWICCTHSTCSVAPVKLPVGQHEMWLPLSNV
jgi:hypothetical protein